MEFRLSRRLSQTFLSRDGISAITEPFTNFSFTRWNFTRHKTLGENSFHICYIKSIYIGSASLKTLPLDLEPPLQGKEYSPSYSKVNGKSKYFCSRNHLYFCGSGFYNFMESKFVKGNTNTKSNYFSWFSRITPF
jgi:hypothetical protein